jgi:hypothetical protein
MRTLAKRCKRLLANSLFGVLGSLCPALTTNLTAKFQRFVGRLCEAAGRIWHRSIIRLKLCSCF